MFSEPKRWIRRMGPPAPTRPCLVIAPHAGAGALPYRPIAAALGGHAEVWAITPPAREARIADPPLAEWPSWLAEAAAAVGPVVAGRRHMFWGHSLGALAAYQLVRRRIAAGEAAPARLIVSGCRPPARVRWQDPDALDDAAIAERLRRLGGTPAEVLASEEVMALVMPALRADFKLAATFVAPAGPPLPCPITALAGIADAAAPHAEMAEWGALTAGGFTLALFPGGHFFPFDADRGAVVAALGRALAGDDA